MGISLSTAKVLAPTAYGINFICQMYGMNSKPNMLDIHYKHIAAFSPYPYAIPLFFSAQQILQIRWIYTLFKEVSPEARRAQLEYAPTFVLGNLCIAAWMVFWNNDQMKMANVFVMINSLSQLYHVAFRLPPRNSQNNLTHWTSKTFAGIGVLDFVHNGSAAYFDGVAPNTLTKIVTPIVSLVGLGLSDSILGGSLAYCLGALAVGQHGDWSAILGGLSAVGAVIAGYKFKNGA
ncbi:hypothetical protein P7C70_g5673, partial [Phenoliferia sp. Uapishka_3]